jgi:hypothetical protein
LPTFLKEYGSATCAFGFPTSEPQAREIDELLQKNDDLGYFKKEYPGFEAFIAGERADVSVLTDDSVDADGDSIDPKTIIWDEFRKNPVVAFGHDYSLPPIGKSLWQKQVGNQWKAKTQYASRPDSFPEGKEFLPDTIYHLIKEGFLPGKSIGAIGKLRVPTAEDIAEKPFLKSAKLIRFDVKVFEYSVVTKNCNKNALVEAVAKGVVNLSDNILNQHFTDIAETVINARTSKKEDEVIPIFKSIKRVKSKEDLVREAINDLNNKTPEIVDNCLAKILGRV